ncbi:hypothetical protein PVAND_012222 [Polypedilum vanderplanki]|uniref:Tyrosine aminotransferase n=1 Tax=Polypedilum vanderplanki TaxID=319348 RepID=A0A9J6CLS4_POLVA|nr:hypothetical protein PVAND_012222 [Polypedilum vanderplanki]
MKKWNIKLSEFGENTENHLRLLIENEKIKGNEEKTKITMRLGDPSVFGNFPPHPSIKSAITEAIQRDKFTYAGNVGYIFAREAVAEYASHMGEIKADDVILTNCCSMSLEMCILALANRGENILVPKPCYHYETFTNGIGIEIQYYNLDPENDWQIDLVHLESLINEKTKAIVVNSPGNPCGNVFSLQHMFEIIDIAERHCLPIISDEIYEFVTFGDVKHYSFASVSKNVPILVCSGLTKRFLTPAIRCGWIIISDRGNKLQEIRKGLIQKIGGRGFGPNSTIQHALSNILKNVPQTFFNNVNARVDNNARLLFDHLNKIKGLRPIMPKGSIFMLLKIELEKFPKISSSMEFMQLLIKEQNVYTFPSECFHFPGYLRLVLTIPTDVLLETCTRFEEFCNKYLNNEQ